MSKLKTLKGLPRCLDCSAEIPCVDYELLRKEAIKWVLHYEEIIIEGNANPEDWIEGKIQSLMDFFNITKEDLK